MQAVSLNSTTLKTAAYQNHSQVLALEFCSGALYHYFGVCQSIYEQLLEAESKGRYYNQHIRNRFAFTKLRAAGVSGNPQST
jgi:hypothetical protein